MQKGTKTGITFDIREASKSEKIQWQYKLKAAG